jgi:hypothetical protein
MLVKLGFVFITAKKQKAGLKPSQRC